MTKIYPLHDRVLVRPAAAQTETAGGIALPDIAQEKSQRGEVIAVGPGRTENGYPIAMTVNVGDTVLFGKFAGQEMKDTETGESLLLMRETDIFAVITE